MGSSKEHGELINAVLILLGREAHHIGRFFRNETGMALNYRTRRPFKYGVVGSPDVFGITMYGYIGLELKTGKAVQSEAQKNFEQMVKKFGQNYFVIHSAQEALEKVLSCKN